MLGEQEFDRESEPMIEIDAVSVRIVHEDGTRSDNLLTDLDEAEAAKWSITPPTA